MNTYINNLTRFGFTLATKHFLTIYKRECFALLYVGAIIAFSYALLYHHVKQQQETARHGAIVKQLYEKLTYVKLENKYYEAVILTCLNNASMTVDGIDRPCKVGHFVDGKEKY